MFTFYSDGSHGWLRVPAVKLEEFNIADKISRCSYMRGTDVYLEEDCDAPIFIKAFCFVARITEKEFNDLIQWVYTDGPSPIRGYNSYVANKYRSGVLVMFQ
jgi:hypothetical protein